MLKKTLESTLDCKEIQQGHPKGNQPWIFSGRTDAEAEDPILWPSDVKNWLIWKDPDAGKDGRWEEKGMTENEMAGWHHWLNGHELEQAPGDSKEQGGLVCYSPWGLKEFRHNLVTELTDWLMRYLFHGGSAGKESACNTGDLGSFPGSGRSPGREGYPLQYSCLENSMDTGAWQAQSMGSQRVGLHWATSTFTFTDPEVLQE